MLKTRKVTRNVWTLCIWGTLWIGGFFDMILYNFLTKRLLNVTYGFILLLNTVKYICLYLDLKYVRYDISWMQLDNLVVHISVLVAFDLSCILFYQMVDDSWNQFNFNRKIILKSFLISNISLFTCHYLYITTVLYSLNW